MMANGAAKMQVPRSDSESYNKVIDDAHSVEIPVK